MPARTRTPKPKQQTPIEQHGEWLTLLRADGPFISAKILAEAFPQGLGVVETALRARLRQAWAELQAAPETLCSAWQNLVLEELLDYRGQALRQGSMLPRELAEGSGTVPDALLMGPADPTSGLPGAAERALIYRRPWGESLTRARKSLPSLVEQAAELCRRRAVPLALLTNGRLWVLVHARPSAPTSFAVFDADLWSEEPLLLRAFVSLMGARCAAIAPKDRDGKDTDSLGALFTRTAQDTTAVTKTLGQQVRAAVELLVAELSRRNREASGTVLADVAPDTVYRAALTVMMRVVFLLYAEEQALLPADDELYAESYSVTKLYERLNQDDATIADREWAAWPTLLATFRAIHGGARHPDMWIPAYGGSLFDPSRFPWLERLKVSDRVVFAMLEALIMLKRATTTGKSAPPERLSYKGLDVEQIGHVYEGLLEHSAVRLDETHLGLKGKSGSTAKLADLETWHATGRLQAEVTKLAGLTDKQFTTALATEPTGEEIGQLDAACDNDPELATRVRPFFGLLRPDLRHEPVVHPIGTVIVTQVGDRRDSGTHYTPRALAEEIVLHTLDPLCFSPGSPNGIPRAADGTQPAEWRVRPASELLALKILDPAMGSGAFLVSACRYLSERVVEAWDRDGVPETVAARLGAQLEDRDALLLEARRMVADRCLYGVDVDEMAVELAKLSLWLVTLAKGRPFNFVDHALRCGDSLIGCLTADQIEAFHLVPSEGRMNTRLTDEIDKVIGPLLSRAAELRRDIEGHEVFDIRDAREKAAKLTEAESLTKRLRLAADAVVAAKLATAATKSDDAYNDRLASIAGLVERALLGDTAAAVEARTVIDGWLRGPSGGSRTAPLRPLHWPLEFPEIISDPIRGTHRFDAVLGNPPFSGGNQLSGRIGKDSHAYIGQTIAEGYTEGGQVDLVAYFLLRELTLSANGRVGMIATKTIAQADTRKVGLDRAIRSNWIIYRAIKSQRWPGSANVHVSLVWLGKGSTSEQKYLNGRKVDSITGGLITPSRVSGSAYELRTFSGQSSQGCKTTGMGFLLEPDEANALIAKDELNKKIILPYLINNDVNNRPDSSPTRWAIDFNDMPEEEARKYRDAFSILEERVRPERQRKKADGSFQLRNPLPQRWWQYEEKRPTLRKMIADRDCVLVIGMHSKYGIPSIVPNGQVFSHSLCVFYTPDVAAMLALLTSAWHFNWWTVKGESTLKGDPRYTPSTGFDTFPQPELTPRIRAAGEELDAYRRHVQLTRTPQLGLTDLYNEVHRQENQDADIQRLREIHVEIDEAVAESYLAHPLAARFGWIPLTLNHGFHETVHGLRWTVDPDVQIEMNDRLLELNHALYEDEVRRGLHTKKGSAKARNAAARKPPQAPGDGLW
ncbi:Eco57I restriction-modification methylase domain-containing protein [Streptomyces gibsoniae]|uniref:site-specific DNA-methyltransferase (adenine-specific) n=1 Tax=Streptomyces gibsoniae TaxID=3075529 RepID=A0ABU2U4L4_9ACTN|nr:DNA methyltransferase [Streptomyces sp. DSM 41699]MDT0468167.1 DNA methyltransferase [Streptomyces sp. DSM 41699]